MTATPSCAGSKSWSIRHNLLNPGVIINPDREAHLANLKQLPSVEPEIDKCIECGYCEPKCPSRELTLTPAAAHRGAPRDGAAAGRSKGALSGAGHELYTALDREFPYMALDTCATDGLCATACPVNIDTGQLVKRFRETRSSVGAKQWAVRISKHFKLTEWTLRWATATGARCRDGHRS